MNSAQPASKKNNVESGGHEYNCKVNENVYSPFTIDTPLYEFLESDETKNLLAQKIPKIYYMMTGENDEMMFGILRLLSVQSFVGFDEDLINELDEKIRKIRVSVNEDDDSSDDQINEETKDDSNTNNDNDKNGSAFFKISLFIYGLIFLF